MSLPLDDPQFWLVTAAAVGGLVYGIRVVRRRARQEAVYRDGLPLRFRFESYSPHNPPTAGNEDPTRAPARPSANAAPATADPP